MTALDFYQGNPVQILDNWGLATPPFVVPALSTIGKETSRSLFKTHCFIYNAEHNPLL